MVSGLDYVREAVRLRRQSVSAPVNSQLASQGATELKGRTETGATAESLTGGLLGRLLTDRPRGLGQLSRRSDQLCHRAKATLAG